MKLVVFVDGAASGNPGPAGIGVVIATLDGIPLLQCAEPIGEATNNIAEYRALLRAIEFLRRWDKPIEHVTICSDSQLIVRQLRGQYRVQARPLVPLWEAVQKELRALGVPARIEHIPRESNREADRLARLGSRIAAGGVQAS
ncbi:MAG: ribonuclease HI family protein [Candidatus Kapabacteria bacterium]|nr:ribonuclease HI family protein [Candidatus Kapabacteria bacterium]MCS7170479.1 ribonuclease HI family protein [Candidatus Kapabacteria bacterium]MDW7997568.1 ribonuclease HI family protein [Bacteroidota bacterium]MDW8226094.1 ribonuclease HI family protein [Bacteroidota bacterium]